MSPILRSLYYVSLFCTFLSLLAHVWSFMGHAFYPALFLVPMLFVIWPMTIWQWRRVPRRNLVSEVFVTVPLWMRIAGGFFVVYPFLNFFLCNALNEGCTPSVLADGRLVLERGQQIVRVLDKAGYDAACAVQTRMLSGHLMAFYGIALITLKALWIKSSTMAAGMKLPKKG